MAGTPSLRQGGTCNIAKKLQKGDPEFFSVLRGELRRFFMFSLGQGSLGTFFSRGCTPSICHHANKGTSGLWNKEIFDFSITFPVENDRRKYRYLQTKVNQWLAFAAIWRKKIIFSLIHYQQKVDLNTSQKALAFVTIRHRKYHLYVQLYYTKIYARIRICGKILLSYIFVWRKVQKIWYFRETETHEN